MNGEIPSVPITTLAGVNSLVDLLPEMPLPSPLPQTLSNKSLLFHPRVADEAQRLINGYGDNNNVIPKLVQFLSQTSSTHIELKDPYLSPEYHHSAPPLLHRILTRNPDVFKGPYPEHPPVLEPIHQTNWWPQPKPQPPLQQQTPPIVQQLHQVQPKVSIKTQIQEQQPVVQPPPVFQQPLPPPPPQPQIHSQTKVQQPNQLIPEVKKAPDHTPVFEPQSNWWAQPQPQAQPVVPQPPPPQQQTPPIVQQLHQVQPKIPVQTQIQEPVVPAQQPPVFQQPLPPPVPQQIQSQTKTHQPNQLIPEVKKEPAVNSISTPTPAVKRRAPGPASVSKPKPEEPEEAPKTKIRKVERFLVPVLEKLSSSSIKSRSGGSQSGNSNENTTYHRFLRALGVVLENSAEYINGGGCEDFRYDVDLDDDGNVPSEVLVPKHQLQELCGEAAKLKALGAMEAIPENKLVELLKLLELNIREGCKVTPLADPDETEEEGRLWIELTMEKIQRGVSSCLTALHILTSQNMPKKVYIEDLIDRIVQFTKYQLQNTIYPSFDPVYRIDRKGKGAFSSGKKKRAHAKEVREKNMLTFYTKIHEVVGLLAELLNVQILTDTTVLHLSTLGVSPFFVENVSEVQLSALKLVTGIFAQYEKHRRLLLDDILASIARLPSSKRGLRTFKLSSGSDECIQMLTALVLQLIQCVTNLPESLVTKPNFIKNLLAPTPPMTSADRDVIITGKYDTALRTAGNFLAVFLSKCSSKSEDCDYKTLFENFVQDLLSTVNKPQWPAAELLLSLLGTLLVKNLGNKSLEVAMRVTSLEYLGVAAARLRKDAVTAKFKMDTIDRLIADIKAAEDEDPLKPLLGTPKTSQDSDSGFDEEEEKIEFLQRLLLDYLAVQGKDDPALMHARHFNIASWYKSAQSDITKALKDSISSSKTCKTQRKKPKSKPKKKPIKNRKKSLSISSSEDEEEDEDSESDNSNESDGGGLDETEINSTVLTMTEKRKKFLLSKIRPFSGPSTSRTTEVLQSYVDSGTAELITRYLASTKPFCASFDFFLTRILSVSSEQTVAIRTKSLRCLAMVVEADANVLARQDMQLWVQNSFLDQSTAVREAAVDLVGKYVLSCHDLIEKYYEMLSLRILDTGVSVRKRVIKILRDICVECPQFPRIPEICVKMIRRVNDEDGIRKLVMEVFQNMWFTPVREDPLDKESVLRKVSHITDVVASCEKIGLDFFEQLLLSLFKPKDDREDLREKLVNQDAPKPVLIASTQIVNCLVEHVLTIEESSSKTNPDPNYIGPEEMQTQKFSSKRFIACVATLHLFAKIRPKLLTDHVFTLEPYLSLKCSTQMDCAAIVNIGNILELVVPLLVNPSETFLARLEEDCVKLLIKNDKSVIESCLACLGAVVNKMTKNYRLVRDIFGAFRKNLLKQVHSIKTGDTSSQVNPPIVKRSVYTIGLFLRYFDFKAPEVYGENGADIVNLVFNDLLLLLEVDQNLQPFVLQAIGNICIRHYDYMLGNELKSVYQNLLTNSSDVKLKCQTLTNIQVYLVEEELRMIKQDQEFLTNKSSKLHDLKEMGDVTSGMASTIVQIYLKQILESFLHSDVTVRIAAVKVVQLILQQGLVHPIQIVPYLICMSTDGELGVSTIADKQLQEIEKKHPQFLQSQVLTGIRLSLQLQRILAGYSGSILPAGLQPPSTMNAQSTSSHLLMAQDEKNNHLVLDMELPIVRGYRTRPKESPSALNGFLYSLVRSTKPQRRAIAQCLLKQFDEQNKNRLSDLLYFADTLAYFPYQVVDEPLFIIHHMDIVISVTGSNLLQAFKESLKPLHPHVAPNVLVKTEPVENNIDYRVDDEFHNPGMNINPVNDEVVEINKVTDIMEDDEDEDVDSILARMPEDPKPLVEFLIGSQGCLLLLMLKQHLKDIYGLTEARISGYSPSDTTKTFERPVNRKNIAPFEPKCVLANLQQPPNGGTPEGRGAIAEQYLHFKQLMLRIDPEEGEEDGETKQVKIKIDQNLFTYPSAKGSVESGHGRGRNASMTSTSYSEEPSSSSSKMNSSNSGNMNFMSSSSSHHTHNSSNSSNHNSSSHNSSSYYVVSQQNPPVAKVEPMVRIPKLTIVPLKFPGHAAPPTDSSSKKSHKAKSDHSHHHHHHKNKKSKHKKKKKYAVVSDDEDSDNPDSDPDFQL